MFALFGLLIAFTFSGALSRLDIRRGQVVDEANAIGTAYLRIDLLPAAAQPRLRESFREYADAIGEDFWRDDFEEELAALPRYYDALLVARDDTGELPAA